MGPGIVDVASATAIPDTNEARFDFFDFFDFFAPLSCSHKLDTPVRLGFRLNKTDGQECPACGPIHAQDSRAPFAPLPFLTQPLEEFSCYKAPGDCVPTRPIPHLGVLGPRSENFLSFAFATDKSRDFFDFFAPLGLLPPTHQCHAVTRYRPEAPASESPPGLPQNPLASRFRSVWVTTQRILCPLCSLKPQPQDAHSCPPLLSAQKKSGRSAHLTDQTTRRILPRSLPSLLPSNSYHYRVAT